MKNFINHAIMVIALFFTVTKTSAQSQYISVKPHLADKNKPQLPMVLSWNYHPHCKKNKLIDVTDLVPDERIEDILKKYSGK